VLHEFLDANRAELIERCRAKVAQRPAPRGIARQADHGIPLFLAQLIETLRGEQASSAIGEAANAAPHDVTLRLAASAARHGGELLQHGFTVDQVVRDYGDLCQSATELAIEKRAVVSVAEFQTLNRCLDDAIAEAVSEFGWQRDRVLAQENSRATNEQLGFLAHELRNQLNTAILAFAVLKQGSVGFNGATSAVLDRSLLGLRGLIDHALVDVRLSAGLPSHIDDIDLASFLADVHVAAGMDAKAKGCEFSVERVDAGLMARCDRELLNSAVSNLLQNAFKFTRSHSHVSLRAHAVGDRALIEIKDQCGGLPADMAETMFRPFEQGHADRSGIGLGLSISRRAVEAMGGKIGVRDIPGEGCIFTIDLARPDAE
jgi:signal transduction histidine kinase